MKILTIILILQVVSLALCAQSNFTIKGYVSDSITGERLIGATVFSDETRQGAVTNNYGYFAFNIDSCSVTNITVSYVGYLSKHLHLSRAKEPILEIKLCSNNQIEQIVVSGKQNTNDNISKISLSPLQIKQIPNITGQPELFRALQLTPGVKQGNEGSCGLYVRGGSPDQNLFLLDDVPLYNVMHLGGIFSVFDASALKSVEMYMGGFPARYGGRISSIVDVRNKDGNLYELHGNFGLSLLLSSAFIEGPIKKGKASFMLSVRRSNIDIYTFLYNKLLAPTSSSVSYYFYDINAKLNYIITPKNRLFFSFYKGYDSFYFKEGESSSLYDYEYKSKSGIDWGNTSTSLRWLHTFNNGVLHNLTFAYENYKYDNKNEYTATSDEISIESNYYLESGIKDILLKSDFQFKLLNNDSRCGAELIHHYFTPTAISSKNSQLEEEQISDNTNNMAAIEGSVYFEQKWHPITILDFNIGIRVNNLWVDSTSFFNFEPRLNANIKITTKLILKASYTQMNQNIHLLTNSGAGLPSDLWVPSTKEIAPEKSAQFTVATSYDINDKYQLNIEAYYKTLKNLIEYKEGVLIYSSSENWDDKVERKGNGTGKGIEVKLEKTSSKLTGWISYTLSKSERKFSNINNGQIFPYKYDQPHNISVMANYSFSKELSVSVIWQYHSGNSITLAEGQYQLTTYDEDGGESIVQTIQIYSDKSAYRMPSYHRLDIGLNYTKHKTKHDAIWNLGVYNLYNRQNAYYLFYKEEDGIIKLYQQSLFPLMFNFGYTYTF